MLAVIPPSVLDSGDTTWVIVSGALVFLMVVFLATFYGSQVRTKNIISMHMKVLSTAMVVTLTWAFVGFSLAFSPGENGFVGSFEYAFLRGVYGGHVWEGTRIPDVAFFFFQMMFAIVTPALVVGAIAERMKFTSWLLFAALWSIFVYPFIAHWLFSPHGWLYQLGARDFAGGIVIHASAGVTALVLAKVLGPRKDDTIKKPDPGAAWTRPLMILSTGVLWFGWFGFNGGSALAMGAKGVAVNAVVSTHFAAVAGASVWLLINHFKKQKATMLGFCTGAIAGLAAVTPASGFITPMSAFLIGGVASLVCYSALNVKNFFRADDSLDVVAVHGFGGITGALLLGFLAFYPVNPAGLTNAAGHPMHGGWDFFIRQAVAVLSIVAYTGLATLVLAWVVKLTCGLRVTMEDERVGLDVALHNEQVVAE